MSETRDHELLVEAMRAIKSRFVYRLEVDGVKTEDNAVVRNALAPLDEFINEKSPHWGPSTFADIVIRASDWMAELTQTKHLARIAQDQNSIRAFCPRCGRHYRYHCNNTGECPKTLVEVSANRARQA